MMGFLDNMRLRRLVQDDSGVTAVEFGILIFPMCLLLLGGLDLGYQSYLTSVTQGALNQSARKAAVENPKFDAAGGNVEKQIENGMKDLLSAIVSDAKIGVTAKNYFDFSGVNNPEKLMTDTNNNGKYDDTDGDCFEDANDNGEYDEDGEGGSDGLGGANDVVFYTAEVSYTRFMPWHKLVDGVSEDVEITVETAIRAEPYADARIPVVICGMP